MLSEFRTLTSAVVQGTLSASGVIYAPGGNSDQWNLNGGGDLSIIQSSSANWESTYTTVSSSSATWGTGGSVYDDSLLQATSGTWDSTYTTVSSNSASWVRYDIEDIATPASWVLDNDTLTDISLPDGSSIKVPTQQSVKAYVDGIVTGINSLKGGYDASTDQPAISAGAGVLQGDSYYVETDGGGLFYNIQVDPGDLIIAIIDNADEQEEWIVVNRNIQDELIDRWNSTHTTVSAQSADWDSTYTTVDANSAAWGIDTDTIYDDSLLQSTSGSWDSTYTTVSSNSASWGIDTVYDDSLLQANSGTWDSTYTTVSSNSAAWGIDTIYDDSLLQSTSGTWDSTYTTVSSNSAAWGSAVSGDFCSTTVLLNEVSACGGTMSVDGLLSASDMTTTTLTADGVYFNTGANRPPELGELVWDGDERTLDLGLDNGVVLQIGEEQIINVKAAENILNGQVVYASGAVGGASGKIEVSLYSASSAEGVDPGATDELFFVGIATQDIALNGFGYITTFGKVRDVHVEQGGVIDRDIVGPENTDVSSSDPGWDLGTILYISTSAGRLTNTKPVSPNKIIPTAMIVGVSGNQRTLFVRQEHGYHIDELHDVRVINPQQNDVLAYNSTLESWDNVTSNNWESTFTTMSANSANWVKYDIEDIATPATWVLDEDTLVSDSAIKVPTQQSVKAYVDGIVTGINSLKGGYDVSTDTPAITAGIGVLQGDSYYVTVSGSFYGQQTADPGDLIIATTDSANLSSEWIVVNRNIQDELIDRWNSTYTTVSSESANWDSTYTTVSINSGTWSAGDVSKVGTPVDNQLAVWTGLSSIEGDANLTWDSTLLDVTGDVNVSGDLTLTDEYTYSDNNGRLLLRRKTDGSIAQSWASLNSDGTDTNTFSIEHVGIAGEADREAFQWQTNHIDDEFRLISYSTGTGTNKPIHIMLNDDSVETTGIFLTSAADVGIGTKVPGEKLTVAGGVSASGTITADCGNSTEWCSTYTTVLAESADWDSTYTTVSSESATWSDTSTVVQNNSGIWDNSAALAYNDGATNSIEIGLLDSTTETGPRAISIQGARSLATHIASGDDAIAIGSYTRATDTGSTALGSTSIAEGLGATAIGYNSVATGFVATAVGSYSRAQSDQASGIGYSVQANGLASSAFGWSCQAKQNDSHSIGRFVINDASNTLEVGYWDQAGGGTRKGSIRMDSQKNVSFSVRTSQLALTDGGATNGAEAVGTLGRQMFAFRRNGDDFYIDANDASGNITTLPLGNSLNNVTTVTSNAYTQTIDTTHTIYNDDDAGVTSDIVATLMAPADHTGTTVHKKVGSSHNVVLTPPSGLIDGAASFTLQFENESVSIFSDGTNFYIT